MYILSINKHTDRIISKYYNNNKKILKETFLSKLHSRELLFILWQQTRENWIKQ